MKNKYLILIIIILTSIYICSLKNKTADLINEEVNVTIKDTTSNIESTINLEDYVIGVVAGEMPASFEVEALKAQAIAARSYAIYKMNTVSTTYDLVTDVSNQVYITIDEMKEKWGSDYDIYYEKIKTAVNSTKGMVLEYAGEVISSYYFSMSNGKTEDAALVFGESKDYLVSVDSGWDMNVNNFEVINTYTTTEFCEKLTIDCSNITIKDITYTESGRVDTIVINDKTYKGTEIRSILGLRSTDFTIAIGDYITITTKGYGHGVGMSQYGANEMAKNGYNYEEILKYYYQNVNITEINV